jgi:4-amino-4-deoxy-L-arabinose transferase-like glycosyltransferase
MPPARRTTVWATAALLAGALLRVFFLLHHPRFSGDTLVYGDLAQNMLEHHIFGFTEEVIRPTLIRLPGYPLFLAACFVLFGHANYLAVIWLQALIDLATCALLGLLAACLMGPRAGLLALWLAALCPFTANYAAAPLTETLSLFCVALAFFTLDRWIASRQLNRPATPWAALLGLSLSAAVLIRPDEGLLAAAVIPVMLWLAVRNPRVSVLRSLSDPALAVAIVALPLLLWGVRNWRVFHVIQPLAPRYANDPGERVPFGFQRWYRTWAIDFKSTYDIYWTYDGSPMALKDLPPRAFDSPAQFAETRDLFARYNAEDAASPALDAAFAQLAAQRVAAHPLRFYLLLPIAREANMLLRPRTELMKLPIDWWNISAHPAASAFEIAYAALDAFYLLLALLGLVAWARRRWTGHAALAAALLGFVLLRSLLLLTLDNSEPRYTLEAFPILILLAAFALKGTGFREC